MVNHLTANSDYEIKISALNRKGTGRPVIMSATTKKKPDRLFITKITDQHNSNSDADYVLKNDLTGLHWLSNQQIISIPATYVLTVISISLGILIFILIIKKKYRRIILMHHSALRANQLNSFATSSNPMSISKCLFPYNKKPELTNEQYDHDHTLMGCCNVDYREDRLDNILMSRHNTNRQLTTFTGLNNEMMIENNNNNSQSASERNQQQFCELNTTSMHFNTYNQLTNSLTTNNLASCSTRDLYDTVCLYSNSNLNNLGNLPSSSLALTNAVSNRAESPRGPPLTPPPSYQASMSMLNLPNLPTPPQSLLNGTTNSKTYENHLVNSLLHHHHSHPINQTSYVGKVLNLLKKF